MMLICNFIKRHYANAAAMTTNCIGASRFGLILERQAFTTISTKRFSTVIPSDEESNKYVKSYALQGKGKGTMVSVSTNTGHSMQLDVPTKMGGKNCAPQPVEHLLAAYIGCTHVTALFVGRNMNPRILIDRMEFDLHAERDERGALQLPIEETPSIPARLMRVFGEITIYLKTARGNTPLTLTPEELALLSEQTEARCPVANMMSASGCEIQVSWKQG